MSSIEKNLKYVCGYCRHEYDTKAECIHCIKSCKKQADNFNLLSDVYRVSVSFLGETFYYRLSRMPRMSCLPEYPNRIYWSHAKPEPDSSHEILNEGSIHPVESYNFYFRADSKEEADQRIPELIRDARDTYVRYFEENRNLAAAAKFCELKEEGVRL